MELQLIDYKTEYQPYFEKLNSAWLQKYFSVEPLDKWVLEQPEDAIIKTGGSIYFATAGSTIVGTVALRFIEDNVLELTKMAVDEAYRGKGVGQFLCREAISKAGKLGAQKLILFSNRVLKNAIHIYQKLGFVEIPVIPGTYGRADIMMEIDFNQIDMQQRSASNGVKTFSEEEIHLFRADTKGTARRIHFNNAGASMPPTTVVEAAINYLNEEAIFGGYETEYKYREQLSDTYSLISQLLNADKDEVAIVENASFAWGIAFSGIDFEKGDELITSEMEYVTNLIGFINAKKTYGIEFKVIPNNEDGSFPLSALEDAISPRTKLIAITHIPSASGNMMPVVEIGKIARKYNILYMVDACQSVGQVPVDVKEIGCDILTATGRKYLRAPRGTGFLYVRKEVQDELKLTFIDGFTAQIVNEDDYKLRNDARRFELYEKNRALTLGLGKAVEYALNIGVDRIWKRIQLLADLMRQELERIPEVTVHDTSAQKCGIVTFSVNGIDADVLKSKLAEKLINTSVGLAKSTLLYMNKNHLTSVVRASVHYYNSEDEIKVFRDTLLSMID
jgi:cysteine desulfurase/selenocysteine lyase